MPDDLPARYELSFYLGEIVRNDTWAENEMKNLWYRLTVAGLGENEPQRDFARVISQVRRQLRNEAVPTDFRDIATDVVEATHRAHQGRRDFVHQILMQPFGSGEVLRAAGGGRVAMSEIAKCAEDLRTAMWRIRGCWIIAPQWVGGDVDYEELDGLRSWTRVAMGYIADDPGMVRGTPGEAPEPPGGYKPVRP